MLRRQVELAARFEARYSLQMRILLVLLGSVLLWSHSYSAEPGRVPKTTSILDVGYNLSRERKKPVCFELVHADKATLLRRINSFKGDTLSMKIFARLIKDENFHITETDGYILIQSDRMQQMKGNPLDLQVEGFSFEGDLPTLKSTLHGYFAANSRGGHTRLSEEPRYSLRIKGKMSVRELFLRVGMEAKLFWILSYPTKKVDPTSLSEGRMEDELADFAFIPYQRPVVGSE